MNLLSSDSNGSSYINYATPILKASSSLVNRAAKPLNNPIVNFVCTGHIKMNYFNSNEQFRGESLYEYMPKYHGKLNTSLSH